MRNRYLTLFMSMIIISLLAAACGKKEDGKQRPKEKTVNIRSAPAQVMKLRPYIDVTGTLYPLEEITVSSEVDGILREIKADEGRTVEKGELIASISDTDYSLEVKRAESALRQAEANLANSRSEHERSESLYKGGLEARRQMDASATALTLAEAEADKARTSLEIAREKLSKTRIYSPVSGIVKSRKVSPGDFMKGSVPLISIVRNNPVRLRFSVPERDAGRIGTGMELEFTTDALPEKRFSARIGAVYPYLDEGTRSVQAEALVPNDANLLKPGYFARIKLFMGAEREVIVVPSNSLVYEGDIIRLFVTDGETAMERIVRPGQSHTLPAGEGTAPPEIIEITSGVKEGEMVVVVGQQNLFEGARVNVAR